MKKSYSVILFAIVSTVATLFVQQANAQAPSWQWSTSVGRLSSDRGTSVATDASGNAYVTGQFSSDTVLVGTSTTLTNAGANTTDMYILKYDNAGTLVWAQKAGGPDYEYATSVALDGSGNIYITGYFNSATLTFGSTTLTNAGTAGVTNDMYLVKYDNNGTVLWAKSATGASGTDRATSVCTYGSGIYVTGYYNSSSLVFGTTTLTNAGPTGYNDLFIVKYDNAGTVQWAKSAGGTNIDFGNSIAADANGVYVAGNFYSATLVFGSTTLTNAGSTSSGDIFIVKYDVNGTPVWAKSAGGTGDDGGYAVAANGSAVYMAGKYLSSTVTFGSTSLTNAGQTDIFLVKYDNAGTVVWAKKAGGSSYENCSNMTVDAAGNTYLTGDFFSPTLAFGGTTLTNAGTNTTDIYIVRYDNVGNVSWAKSAGGTTGDIGFGICVNALGAIYVTGDFTSTSLVLGTTTLANKGGADMFLGRLSDPTGISAVSLPEHAISLSPNPTSGVFKIQIINGQSASGQMEIYNVLGEKVHAMRVQGNEINVTLPSDMEKGTYFLKIQLNGEQGVVTRKLVVQ